MCGIPCGFTRGALQYCDVEIIIYVASRVVDENLHELCYAMIAMNRSYIWEDDMEYCVAGDMVCGLVKAFF